MKFVSLFAGIGGFDLGLERAGHTCVGQVEIDPYCQRVLEKHWPDVPRHDDVKTFHGSEFGDFDLLTGGYPCQPFSNAGKRAGENDPRHLWPEVHRIIRNVRPRFVLLENVSGHLSLGFGRVLGDLAESGYDAEWDCIPASAVGAPHRRDRVFILAYPSSERTRSVSGSAQADRRRHAGGNESALRQAHGANGADRSTTPGRTQRDISHPASEHSHERHDHTRNGARPQTIPEPRNGSWSPAMADANCERSRDRRTQQDRWTLLRRSRERHEREQWAVEPQVGRLVDGVPDHVDQLRALGNAVVPQVAEYLGRRLPV